MMRARRGSVEGPLLIFLAVLLAIGVFATFTRGLETSRAAVRVELTTQLTTALESSIEEAWWQVGRAVPATAPAAPEDGEPSMRSKVLAALEAGSASASTPGDAVPIPVTSGAVPGGAAEYELAQPVFVIHRVDGADGEVAVRAHGTARRGPITVSFTVEHRRRYHVEQTAFAIGDQTQIVPTVYIDPELVDVEVSEK